jgi:hypothetical protein
MNASNLLVIIKWQKVQHAARGCVVLPLWKDNFISLARKNFHLFPQIDPSRWTANQIVTVRTASTTS